MTFRPQLVTKVSKQIIRNPGAKPEDYLINYGKIIKEKHAKLRHEYKQLSEDFEFKPKINKRSERIVEVK